MGWGRRGVIVAAAGAVALTAVVALLAGCCARVPAFPPPHRLPAPSAVVRPVPAMVEASPDTLTRIEMRNVLFHLDDDARLHILRLNGTMQDVTGHHVVDLDDKRRLRLGIHSARITLAPQDLSLILNRYIFGYPHAPIRGLVVRIDGTRFEQSGILHKGIDIPFTMTATLSVADGANAGMIRLHPTSMKICSLEGLKRVHALGLNLQKMIDLRGAKGVRAEGDDLLLDPLASLPPPAITGHLTSGAARDGQLIQDFGEPDTLAAHALAPPIVAPNYVYMKGGTIKFGKLFMVQAALETIDADPSDPFDFYLDYYASQLVNGYHVTRPDLSLVAWMPDFDKLGTPAGRVTVPLESAPLRADSAPRH